MQKAELLFILLFGISSFLFAFVTPTDSLKNLLDEAGNKRKKCEICVHLADLSVDSSEVALKYWDKALDEATACHNETVKKIALNELVTGYSSKLDSEKVAYYIRKAKVILPVAEKNLFVSYLRSWSAWLRTVYGNSESVLKDELALLKNKEKLNQEEQIEWEFLLALSMDCASVESGSYSTVKEAVPYVEHALELLSYYPKQQSCFFKQICYNKLSNLYTVMPGKASEVPGLIDKMIEEHNVINDMDLGFDRVFLDDFYFYANVYSKIIYLREEIPEKEAAAYYNKLIQQANNEARRSCIYDVMSIYNWRMGYYDKALLYVDSCIAYRKKKFNVIDLITPYEIKVGIYEDMQEYKLALKTLQKCDSLREASRSEGIKQDIAEMQARFDVYRLQLEKAKLSNRNKLAVLMGCVALLLVFISWAFYQRVMMKRLKRVQEDLIKSNEEVVVQRNKASESEKMKTAFLNSMCHEIRTPLNAINGFTDLLLDKSIADSLKTEFPAMIQENTTKLTDLLNTMIELSSLICSTDMLPVNSADIFVICRQEIDLLNAMNTKPEVTAELKNREEICLVWTHPSYLSLVLKNLLNNALKFTDKGKIILSYTLDAENKELKIIVTDEGIGISPDKQEWVFERFTKVDSFKPGTGLGLYICRLVITRLGGTICIDPSYKDGCRIIIILPQG